MVRQPLIYGLDIETDTRIDGLDPGVSSVVAIAICTIAETEVFLGDEWLVLAALEQYLAALTPGVIVTWNGSVFDLPFINDRAAFYGIRLGLRLEAQRKMGLGQTLVGHNHSYRASWHGHSHLDLCQVYKPTKAVPQCNLRQEALHANATHDAELVRVLAGRRWNLALPLVDATPSVFAPAVNHDKRVAAMRKPAEISQRAS